MNKKFQRLVQRYTATMKKYLADEPESVLEEAYELGRDAIAGQFGLLDIVRAHMEAREELLTPEVVTRGGSRVLKAAGNFFLQVLSPFEATHRGFSEMNARLQERNQELEAEIAERKRAESALRRSEEHYHRLFNEAQIMQESLRNLSNKILHTQEEERKRISRELHDEVGQSLTAISVTLASLKSNGAGNPASARKLADTQGLLRETMETVHGFARDLRPAMLDELGLLPALRSYLKSFSGRTGLRIYFHGNPIVEKLADDQKTVVFRITQESLTNVSKHAHASRVDVTIRKLKDSICLEIIDDGRSFQAAPDLAGNNGRLGLLGMQERVRLVGGQFAIRPQPGKGTTVRVLVPLNPRGMVAMPLNKQTKGVIYGKNKSSAG